MRVSFFFLVGITAAVLLDLSVTAAGAKDVQRSIVFIKCDVNGETAEGSGVVVSARGDVITAQHVVRSNGAKCRGSIGVRDPDDVRLLNVQAIANLGVDVALLRFANQTQPYDFVSSCALEDWMVGKSIFVTGFPDGSETGSPSFRQGVLSTSQPNSFGILETDSQTINGMSGGPVFTKNLAGLVGIVIGAKFSPTGLVTYSGILPLAERAQALGLVPSTTPCYHRSNEVDLSGRSQWKSGDAPLKLGVRVDDGVCFIGSVWGQFNDDRDSVTVEVQDGEYVLNGADRSGGQHGASARCIWYD